MERIYKKDEYTLILETNGKGKFYINGKLMFTGNGGFALAKYPANSQDKDVYNKYQKTIETMMRPKSDIEIKSQSK